MTSPHHHSSQRRFSHSKVSALSFSRPSANVQRCSPGRGLWCGFLCWFLPSCWPSRISLLLYSVFPVCPDPGFVGFLVIGVIRRGFSCSFGDQYWSFSFSKTLVFVVIVWEGKFAREDLKGQKWGQAGTGHESWKWALQVGATDGSERKKKIN